MDILSALLGGAMGAPAEPQVLSEWPLRQEVLDLLPEDHRDLDAPIEEHTVQVVDGGMMTPPLINIALKGNKTFTVSFSKRAMLQDEVGGEAITIVDAHEISEDLSRELSADVHADYLKRAEAELVRYTKFVEWLREQPAPEDLSVPVRAPEELAPPKF